ncbi:hypothetical protein FUAX_16420 [Fulvitalea axinellae]|uniref:Cadherin domain-containing protein n=1 Tax=Fulvitalea axinellae TaxID=1182444 RepID=A0AAU9DA83_9BACT|nr:hypothetical protein FUAX_16420 [Fulvitalea axinellae]
MAVRQRILKGFGASFLLLLLFGPLRAYAQTPIHVDINATGAGDGTSWTNAFNNLGNVIRDAPAGSEIWVKVNPGTPFDPKDEGYPNGYFIDKELKIYGGFQGGENLVNQRNANDRSIIEGVEVNNHRAFRITLEASEAVVIENFEIKSFEGDFISPLFEPAKGVGFYVDLTDGELTIKQCDIRSNIGYSGIGGYFDLSGDSRLTISNCEFSGNDVVPGLSTGNIEGGGLAIKSRGTSSVRLSSNKFFNNTVWEGTQAVAVESAGGGVFLDVEGTVGGTTISNNRFYHNVAENGGGIKLKGGAPTIATIQFSGNIFEVPSGTPLGTANNEAKSDGGAADVEISGNASLYAIANKFVSNLSNGKGGACKIVFKDSGSGTALFQNNTFTDNTSGGDGGGLNLQFRNEDANISTQNNVSVSFLSNTFEGCESLNGNGGGAFLSLSDDFGLGVSLDGDEFNNNTAQLDGGGVYVKSEKDIDLSTDNDFVFKKLIFEGNTATATASNGGGGLFFGNTGDECTVLFMNSLLTGNTSKDGGGVFFDLAQGDEILKVLNSTIVENTGTSGASEFEINATSSELDIVNSIIYNTTSPVAYNLTGTGIVDFFSCAGNVGTLGVPTFVSSGDFHLSPNSVGINDGDASLSSELGSQDLEGDERVVGGTVDVGALETNIIDEVTMVSDNALKDMYAGPAHTVTITIKMNLGGATLDPGVVATINGASATVDTSNPAQLSVSRHMGHANDNDGVVAFEVENIKVGGKDFGDITEVTEGSAVIYDETPPTVQPGQILTILENSNVNENVGTVVANDNAGSGIFSYAKTLSSPNDFKFPSFLSGTLAVQEDTRLDRENFETLTLEVKVTDYVGNQSDPAEEVTVKIQDVNEYSPNFNLTEGTSVSVIENRVLGTKLFSIQDIGQGDDDPTPFSTVYEWSIENVEFEFESAVTPVTGTLPIGFDSNTSPTKVEITDVDFFNAEKVEHLRFDIVLKDNLTPVIAGLVTEKRIPVSVGVQDFNEYPATIDPVPVTLKEYNAAISVPADNNDNGSIIVDLRMNVKEEDRTNTPGNWSIEKIVGEWEGVAYPATANMDAFEISNLGEVKVLDESLLDMEHPTTPVDKFVIHVKATDLESNPAERGGVHDISAIVTVTLIDVPEHDPDITSAVPVTGLLETDGRLAPPTGDLVVANLEAEDPDASEEIDNWTILSGNIVVGATEIFEIEYTEGVAQIVVKGANRGLLDLEVLGSLAAVTLEVKAHAGGEWSASEFVHLTFDDVNDNPTSWLVITDTDWSVQETNGVVVIPNPFPSTDVEDDDVGKDLRWRINPVNPLFTINPISGDITVDSDNLDYESATKSYDLPVEVSDRGDWETPALTRKLTVNVTDKNEAKPIIASKTFTVNEKDESWTETLTATDSDTETSFANWTIVSATPNVHPFKITTDGGNGKLEIIPALKDMLDQEGATPHSEYKLRIQVQDTGTPVQTSEVVEIVIKIEDEDEFKPNVNSDTETVNEEPSVGDVIYASTFADGDKTKIARNWKIENTDSEILSTFEIDPNNGEIKIKAETSLLDRDDEDYANITLQVSATDSDGVRGNIGNIEIIFSDINDETPEIEDVTFTIPEYVEAGGGNYPNNVNVHDLDVDDVTKRIIAKDKDATPVTNFTDWTIVPNDAFNIVADGPSQAILTVKDRKLLDAESKTEFVLTVTAKEDVPGGESFSGTVKVVLNNENELPPVVVDQLYTINENQGSFTQLVDGHGGDVGEDRDDLSNWAISGGDDEALAKQIFNLDVNTGELTFKPGFEALIDQDTPGAQNEIKFGVTANDGTFPTDNPGIVTINITAVDDNDPYITAGQTFSVFEDKGEDFKVGDIDGGDKDLPGEALTWSITSGNILNAFKVNDNGELFVAGDGLLDAETKKQYILDIEISDGTDPKTVKSITVDITDVNEADPKVKPNQSFTVSETDGDLSILGLVVWEDDDLPSGAERATEWVIETPADSPFEIISINGDTQGQLRVKTGGSALIDFEDKESYSLMVKVKDRDNYSIPVEVKVSVTDVNDELPVITPNTFFIDENSLNGSEVAPAGDIIVTDEDAGDTPKDWTIVPASDPDGVFAINDVDGQITVAKTEKLDYDTTPEFKIQITVSDQAGNISLPAEITIKLNDLNEHTPVITAGQRIPVPEDAVNDQVFGVVVATDDDGGAVLSGWKIVGGEADNFFTLTDDGELKVKNSPAFDRESTKFEYTLEVVVSDGDNLSDAETVIVEITDVNDVPPVITETTPDIIPENAGANTPVMALEATDGDVTPTASFSWIISGSSVPGAFDIDESGSEPELVVKDSNLLDREATETVTVSLIANDGIHASAEKTFTITLRDVNDEKPVVTAGQIFGIFEGALKDEEVKAEDGITDQLLMATDPDVTDASADYSWTIDTTNPGDGDALFAVDDTGKITVKEGADLDFETPPNSYTLNVLVYDGVNFSAPQPITIKVLDGNETPSFTAGGDKAWNEDDGLNSGDGMLEVQWATDISDGDSGTQGLTFVVDAVNKELFDVQPAITADGLLRFKLKPNAFGKTDVSVYLKDDGDPIRQTDPVTFEITIISQNDPPTITPIDDITILAGEDLPLIDFTIDDTDHDLDDLTITVSHDEPGKVLRLDDQGRGGIILTQSGNDRTIEFDRRKGFLGSFTVTITVSDGVETVVETFKVTVNFQALSLDIPTMFTPNNDGLNETWNIVNLELYEGNKVSVYTLEGHMVFERENYGQDFEWDGTDKNGNEVKDGMYMYVIKLSDGQSFDGILLLDR